MTSIVRWLSRAGRRGRATLVATACFVPVVSLAQEPSDAEQQGGGRPEQTRIYDAVAPIALTLTMNIDRIRQDRDTSPRWRWGSITLGADSGARGTIPVRVRPRGIWRRQNCRFPPLRLDFARATSAGSPFEGLDRPKLVNHCHDDDRSEQYILQEFQLYRLYSLLTPRSPRARLLHVSYADSARGRVRTTRYAILTEDANAMAARLGGRSFAATGATSTELDLHQIAVTSVFQYLIGNTDWSVAGLHNVEVVLTEGGQMYAVAYDFDFSGAINAHYAAPLPMLRIPNVRTRLFRGPCLPAEEYERAFALFRERREAIWALYQDEVGALLRPATVKRTLDYFEEFYQIINDPRRAKRDILDACLKGT